MEIYWVIMPIFVLFASHCIGDYALQSEFLSKYKSESTLVMLSHCIIYTATVIMGVWILAMMFNINMSLSQYSWFAIFIFLSHFIIDTWKCQKRHQLEEKYHDLEHNRLAHKFDVEYFHLDQTAHFVILGLIYLFMVIITCF